MECKIYHTVGTIPKSNIKIVGKHKLDTPSKQIHDRSLSWHFNQKVAGLS